MEAKATLLRNRATAELRRGAELDGDYAIRVTRLADLSTADIAAWDELAGRAVEPNPFFEPAFALAAARAFPNAPAHLLAVEGGEGWIGAMPVQFKPRFGGTLRMLRTWDHPYSFLGTPLVDADGVGEFAAAIVECVAERGYSRFAALEGCGEGIVLHALREQAKADPRTTIVYESPHLRAALERRPTDDYLAGMKPRHRRETNRQRRRLGEELGGELEAVDRSDDPAAVEDFLRLEASGWKGRNGTAMADREADATLLREICTGFGAHGRLQLLSLGTGERPAAMKVNIGAGDTLFCFKIAYDEELSRFSPGILLELDNVDAFHRHRGERLMDSCAQPHNEMINRLWPDRRSISTLVLGPDDLSTRLLRQARTTLRKIRGSDRD
jgi:CelD/BcsL family acetyltransferase involved in cellulose biosynthesis